MQSSLVATHDPPEQQQEEEAENEDQRGRNDHKTLDRVRTSQAGSGEFMVCICRDSYLFIRRIEEGVDLLIMQGARTDKIMRINQAKKLGNEQQEVVMLWLYRLYKVAVACVTNVLDLTQNAVQLLSICPKFG